MAMAVLIVDEETLEFGIQPAYLNFSKQARQFLETQGIGSQGPSSMLTIRIILAIIGALLGAFMTFPGLRLAKMHSDAVKYAAERPFLNILLHINMIFPLIISLMWVKPAVRDFVVRRHGKIKIDDETFEMFRISMILAFCLVRLLLVWPHLQAHLNMAVEKMERLRKEAGRISAIELQKMVARVFYYLCVVALQYLAPIILLCNCAFMLKTLGDFSIAGSLGYNSAVADGSTQQTAMNEAPSEPIVTSDTNKSDSNGSIFETAAQMSLALSSLREVFTPVCFRGVFSFLCWWLCTTGFTTSAFGMIYYSYFTE